MRMGLSSDQMCLLANVNSRHGKMRSGRQERPFYKKETQAAPSDTTKLGKKIFGSHLPFANGIRQPEKPFRSGVPLLMGLWSSECCISGLDKGLPGKRECKGRRRFGHRMFGIKAVRLFRYVQHLCIPSQNCVICPPTKNRLKNKSFIAEHTGVSGKSSYLLVKK